jgi:hypothetical protein
VENKVMVCAYSHGIS